MGSPSPEQQGQHPEGALNDVEQSDLIASQCELSRNSNLAHSATAITGAVLTPVTRLGEAADPQRSSERGTELDVSTYSENDSTSDVNSKDDSTGNSAGYQADSSFSSSDSLRYVPSIATGKKKKKEVESLIVVALFWRKKPNCSDVTPQ